MKIFIARRQLFDLTHVEVNYCYNKAYSARSDKSLGAIVLIYCVLDLLKNIFPTVQDWKDCEEEAQGNVSSGRSARLERERGQCKLLCSGL